MQISSCRPWFLLLLFCRLGASVISILHYPVVKTGYSKIRVKDFTRDKSLYKHLQNIWFTRITRRVVSLLVRSPFQSAMLDLLHFNFAVPSKPAVIVTCHTPWARLLAKWCNNHEYGYFIASGQWIRRSPFARSGWGVYELRRLVRYLQSGGRLIIMADVFTHKHACDATFLGKPTMISLLPARLAKIASVPLLTIVSEWRDNAIQIDAGPRIEPELLVKDEASAMKKAMQFLENKIRNNPSVWSDLSRAAI